MPRLHLTCLVVMLATMTVIIDACKECACKNYAPETAEATYCRYHRDAVWDYVEQSTDMALQKGQLTRMEALYKAIADCGDMDCVFREVQADSIATGFAGIFASANADAEEEVDQAEFDHRKVLLCGLMNGIADWRDSLGVEDR